MNTKKFNPGALGLIGFGTSTILLNLHNAGIIDQSVVVIAMGIMLGGLAQVIAGLFELKQGNTFGGTVFTAYGLFWLSLVYIWTKGDSLGLPADKESMGYYLLVWGIFTGFMTIAAWHHNFISKIIFVSLTLLFIMLAISDFTGLSTVYAGVIGIISGASALYAGMAAVVNNETGKQIFKV